MWFVIIGVISGVISGMGIGGGTVLIPALVIFFNMSQQTAQTINLIYFIPTAIMALIIHFKKGTVEKKLLFKIILFGLISAGIASFLAVKINSEVLKKMFGVFLFIMGILEFLKKDYKKSKYEQK